MCISCGKKVTYIPDEIAVITDFPVKLEDFAVPEEFTGTFIFDGWSVSRKRTPVWSSDQVREYWIDPVDIGLEYLEDLNDQEIKNLFKGID